MPNRDVCADNTGAETGFQTFINNSVALQDKELLSHSGVVRGSTESSQAITPLLPRYQDADAGHRSRSAGLVSRHTEVVFSDLDTAETMQPTQPPERSHEECVGHTNRVDIATTKPSVLLTKSGLGMSGVGNRNTIRPQIGRQLFRGYEAEQFRTTQDSSMFRPISPDSSRYRGVPQQMGSVDFRPPCTISHLHMNLGALYRLIWQS